MLLIDERQQSARTLLGSGEGSVDDHPSLLPLFARRILGAFAQTGRPPACRLDWKVASRGGIRNRGAGRREAARFPMGSPGSHSRGTREWLLRLYDPTCVASPRGPPLLSLSPPRGLRSACSTCRNCLRGTRTRRSASSSG